MKTLLVPFFTIPGAVILLLLVVSLLLWRKRTRKAWAVLVLAIVVGWVGSTQAFGRMISLGLVAPISGPAVKNPKQTDLIVVLTGGMTYGGEQIGWLPRNESFRRAVVAFEVQNFIGSRVPVLISGGHTAGLKYPSEAKVVESYFDRHNAQLTPTVLEESSTNTYESSLQVAALIQKRGARQVMLVTSEPHMLRGLASYRARGVDAIPFPVITLPRGKLGLYGYLPTWEGARLTSHALYEYYGLISYLLSGKISWSDLTYEEDRT